MSELKGKNIFLTPDGRTYHLGVKKGDLASLIVTVGCEQRARVLAAKFLTDVTEVSSSRQFYTFTGKYIKGGQRMSIVCIGMGAPMADFFIREASFVLEGEPLAVVRIGSCGIVDYATRPGTLMLSDESMYCYRNYCHFDGEAALGNKRECGRDPRPYLLTAPVKADKRLTDLIEANLNAQGAAVKRGLNCSAETFFACQGRELPLWNDNNANLLKDMTDLGVVSLEMETHQIFHLMHQRQHSIPNGPKSYAASLMIGLVNRSNPNLTAHVTAEDQDKATLAAGEAAFDALVTLVSEGIIKPAA
ncbi:phosphorylase family protein [Toxoplasma gondii ME49]|uniref:Phosphorylase family protein n=12 Tax=Toxoplasma gondii TaxID=5811 RepID=A0A0F7V4E5_TOXGV|nr:phosphorylase family protein [Toxoplasma gondii ME49]ABC94783.1 uridine phosphorylase [Toxoplasma gondii]EPR60903.1 phosphorylase family protein [Toxoplasma gondii GT1]ESS34962.1 phosphorylase family protein [Toxoplasma gondii VEG]KFG40972.1 phosphorylase family protein [Toxoplasma gondii p89]KFG44454.1 phosphorylase family protein [Toxoplasma gondii GAB2-2007-GAL-DOM2]KFG55849.1 phosphorylase family protein [Toxoplasma gondii FOU]KFG65836.1 phosphorylase family protein [Toxoplasma gondii|eukprot:XP_002364310.1 phosphorylase family protein [Toxoplasma gondii ME49]